MGWPKGKRRPAGWGKKKGTRNRVTVKREAQISASGLTPLEYMLKVLRNPKNSDERRMWAANAAAPYVHPRLASTQLSTPPGQPLQMDLLGAQPDLIGIYLERTAQISADHAARRVARRVEAPAVPHAGGGAGDLPD